MTSAVPLLRAADLAEPLLELQDGDVNIHDVEVVKMWTAPMPRADVLGAGYPQIEGVRHALVFAATDETGGYNHHAQIAAHKGTIYALWSNNRHFEDAPGQRVLFATSPDGLHWSSHAEAFPSPGPFKEKSETGLLLTTLGWVQVGDKLFALAKLTAMDGFRNPDNTLFSPTKDRKRGIIFDKRIYYGILARELTDAGTWGPIFTVEGKPPAPDQIAFPVLDHSQCVSPGEYQAILAASKEYSYPWRNRLPRTPGKPLLCEPSTYALEDGTLVTLFRDERYSHRLFVSTSPDGGNTWSTPYPTNIPDSPSYTKTIALEDGSVVMVGNQIAEEKNFDNPKPAHLGRDTLVLSLSKDGLTFDKAYSLREGKHAFRVPGVGGRGYTGAQYPSLLINNDNLLVIYSIAKEDIEVSSVPIGNITR
jgi:hypothetical protein